MRVLLYVNQDGGQAESDEWLRQFRAKLPEADVQLWRDPSSSVVCDYAVVWKAPRDLLSILSESFGIKAIFNLGAGVDALLAQGGSRLAARVPIVRVDDAGMAEQMSDYVAASVLRYFRNFHEYAAQQQQGAWKPQLPVEKSSFAIGLLGYGVLSRWLRACAHRFHLTIPPFQARCLHSSKPRVHREVLEAHAHRRAACLLWG
jgi:glyoxylate/hydroxypyruvate reductase A